jgi:hypothetical protein
MYKFIYGSIYKLVYGRVSEYMTYMCKFIYGRV